MTDDKKTETYDQQCVDKAVKEHASKHDVSMDNMWRIGVITAGTVVGAALGNVPGAIVGTIVGTGVGTFACSSLTGQDEVTKPPVLTHCKVPAKDEGR